jgi:hypothetical protein
MGPVKTPFEGINTNFHVFPAEEKVQKWSAEVLGMGHRCSIDSADANGKGAEQSSVLTYCHHVARVQRGLGPMDSRESHSAGLAKGN